jgi:pyruvate dehydrogenase E1 component alpha subunit
VNRAAAISAERGLALLRAMIRIRRVEERIAVRYAEQQMRCPTHLCVGQEAAPAGVCAALAPGDYAMSAHRSHGHYLAKGGDLGAMIAELYGRATGCSRGRGGSMHLVDLDAGFLGATPIVASTIPIAVGAALAASMRGEPRVAVAFFGDAALEEGTAHEALAFASLERLPVLFVCENNRWSVNSPLSVRQPAGRTLCDLARGHGIESHASGADDVFEIHAMAERAVLRAREGGGPTFLEHPTDRWLEHCGPERDEALGYRSAAEVAAARARCPIERAKADLRAAWRLDDGWLEETERTVAAEIDAAFEFARTSPFPDPAELCAGVVSDP